MTRLKSLLVLSMVLISFSCERIEYFPDKPITSPHTYILAHKGGGYFEGNTFEGCVRGLRLTDGIEVDVQKSVDNDLWLSHSPKIKACGVFEETCFASLPNETIIEIDNCLGRDINYTRLEAVFSYMSGVFPDKFISLDVKAWSPCHAAGLNVVREMNQLGDAIIELTKKYKLENRVMVESESGEFLVYIKKKSKGIETYLATMGDFELGISRALHAGFSGVSFQYKSKEPITKELVDMLHRKGLKIQLWTVNDPADIEEAKSLGPDFIQTDNFE